MYGHELQMLNVRLRTILTVYVLCACAGGEADGPAAADHRVRPLRLRARPGPLPVQELPAEVHRDLRAEGKL